MYQITAQDFCLESRAQLVYYPGGKGQQGKPSEDSEPRMVPHFLPALPPPDLSFGLCEGIPSPRGCLVSISFKYDWFSWTELKRESKSWMDGVSEQTIPCITVSWFERRFLVAPCFQQSHSFTYSSFCQVGFDMLS